MQRPLVLPLLLAMAGCYGSPADLEGQPCNSQELCPANYVCEEGGCVSSPGARGPTASSGAATHTTGTTASGAVATATLATGTTGGVGTANTTGASGVAIATSTAATTTHATATTVGFTATATGTTGGGVGICSSCTENAGCLSQYCNFSLGGPEGYCDSFECGTNPGACNPYGCGANGLGCACAVVDTAGTTGVNTSSIGTTGTGIGTTGSNGLPICSICVDGAQCASTYCNLGQGSPGFCDSETDCFANPNVCLPYGCSSNPDLNCACTVITDGAVTMGTAAGPTAVGFTGATATGTTGGGSTTGGGLGFCQACGDGAQCASGCCDDSSGTTCASLDGFCDDANACQGTNDCGGFACNAGVCCGGIIIGGAVATSSTSGNGSSGTSGTSGTTGTSGSCVGPGIVSNADCGGAHQVCGSGQACGQFTTLFGTTFYGCACTSSQNGGTDSCRAANDVPGGNGQVVCDTSTLSCRSAQDEEQPFHFASNLNVDAGGPCAAGYGTFAGGNGVDAGAALVCAQACTTTSDCTAVFTSCSAGAVVFPDGTVSADHCGYNVCGPLLGAVDAGGTYYGACTSVGFGDGTCQPIATDGQYIGLCFRNGMGGNASACGGTLGPASTACVSGDLCVPEGQPVDICSPQQTTYCLPTCNSNSPTEGPVTPPCASLFGFATSCQAFSGDPSGSLLQAGVCY